MTINRYAARADPNRAEIVAVFRAHGWSVYDLRRPVDLLVGKGNRITMLVEIKRDEKATYTPAQVRFMAEWKGGPIVTVRDVEGALTVARMA